MFLIFRMICLEKEKRKLSKWLSFWLEHFYMYPCRLSIERKCCHVKLIHVFTFKKSDALIKCFQLYSALIEKHLLMNWKEFASLHFPCFAWFLFSHLLGHFSLQDCFKNTVSVLNAPLDWLWKLDYTCINFMLLRPKKYQSWCFVCKIYCYMYFLYNFTVLSCRELKYWEWILLLLNVCSY